MAAIQPPNPPLHVVKADENPPIDPAVEWLNSDLYTWKGKKGGELAATGHNARVLLRKHPEFRGKIKWNSVSGKVEIHGGVLAPCAGRDVDTIISNTMDYFSSAKEWPVTFGRDELGHRICEVAMENEYDPIADYLRGLKWDGTKRIDNWLATYCGAEEEAKDNYVTTIGRKYLLSCAARALRPGTKVDTVLVTESLQGKGKTTTFEILGGDWYCDVSVVLGSKDSKITIGGVWIAELPDMASFKKSEINAVKAFFTARKDRFRPPYGKGDIERERRVVFGSTTNDEDYLTDPTGNRRFWPVRCGTFDTAGLLRDRDQLWAEAVAILDKAQGCTACAAVPQTVWREPPRCGVHRHWLNEKEAAVAEIHAALREQTDVWAEPVLVWCANPLGTVTVMTKVGPVTNTVPASVTIRNILQHSEIKMDLERMDKRSEMRVAAILRQAKWTRTHEHTDWVWSPPIKSDK